MPVRSNTSNTISVKVRSVSSRSSWLMGVPQAGIPVPRGSFWISHRTAACMSRTWRTSEYPRPPASSPPGSITSRWNWAVSFSRRLVSVSSRAVRPSTWTPRQQAYADGSAAAYSAVNTWEPQRAKRSWPACHHRRGSTQLGGSGCPRGRPEGRGRRLVLLDHQRPEGGRRVPCPGEQPGDDIIRRRVSLASAGCRETRRPTVVLVMVPPSAPAS